MDEVIETAIIDVSKTMIIDQAKLMKNCKWTPVKTFESYPSGTVKTFTAGVQEIGIPYSIGTLYDDSPYEDLMKTVAHNGPDSVSDGKSTISILCFQNEVANKNSLIYAAYKALPKVGPLYGCDCGEFVSFCWKIKRTTSGLYSTREECTQLSRSVSVLQVGDALVKAGEHCVLIKAVSSSSVTIWEQTPPQVSESVYSKSDIKTKYIDKGYIPYRLNAYNLTFNSNGGSAVSPSNYIVASTFDLGTYVPIKTPTRTNYNFFGWYDQISGGNRITSSSKITKDTIAYARWMQESVADGIPCIIPETDKNVYINQKKENEK